MIINEFYKAHRLTIRKILRLGSASLQILGTILHQADYQNAGGTLAVLGLIIGFVLLFQSNSVKEAVVNITCSILPIPALTLGIVILVVIIGAVQNPGQVSAEKFVKTFNIAFGLLTMVAIAAWPFLATAFGLKILSIVISRNLKS